MLFPEDDLFDYVRIDLAAALKSFPLENSDPLPCDRWIARSALQKAIRRGEESTAVRALARLAIDDRSAIWRHLMIIALEDIGTANPELLAQIIAAKQDRNWRKEMGGDWHVFAGLVRMMAVSNHCQANCDLLLKIENDPGVQAEKSSCLDASWATLASVIEDSSKPLVERANAALAMGGKLSSRQTTSDAAGLFEIFAELGHFSHVVATCRAAWKISRNPMAMLMPLCWQSQSAGHIMETADPLPYAEQIDGVPGYALDQFTRVGNAISRQYLKDDCELRSYFAKSGVPENEQPRVLGDIIFLLEGGLAIRRVTWPAADSLRQPHRWLPAVAKLGPHLSPILAHCQDKGRQLGLVRRRLYPSVAGSLV